MPTAITLATLELPVATATLLPEWVDGRAAARIIGGVSPRNVADLAERGLVTTREIPGVRSRYYRPDLETLKASTIRPANRPHT